MQDLSKQNSDKNPFFPVRICVLPQVASWGKGILCHLMAISTALSIFFYVDSFFFQFYIIFEGGCEFEEYFSSLSLKILSTKVSNKQIRPIPKPKMSVRPALIFNNFSHISIFYHCSPSLVQKEAMGLLQANQLVD